jgi:spore coat protein CotH
VPKVSLHDGYTKEEGEPLHGEPGAYDDLDALVQWVATASPDEFYEQLDQHVVQSEFEAWWIFVSLIQATDSAGKNSYLYHDPRPDADSGRWRFVPWDFNACFGQNYRTWRLVPTQHPASFRKWNGLFERMLAEPRIADPLVARYADALQDAYRVDAVLGLFDAWAAQIEPSALRDEQRWIDAFRAYDWERDDFTTHLQEIEYVRAWIAERWNAVDEMLR